MGLPTDSYIDVEISGDVVDRIGLSAPLTDISEIISGGYCGMHHLLWRNGQTKTTDADYTVSKTIPVELSGNTFPITVSEGHGDYNYPDGMFCGIVWLYSENSPMDYCINSTNISDYKLVTEWDAPHYVYKPSDLHEGGHWSGITHESWSDNDMPDYVWNTTYNNNFMKLEYWDDNEGTNVVNIDHIRPYLMYQNENGKYFLSIYDYSYQATYFYADTDTYAATTTLKDYTDSENIAFCVAIKSLSNPNILPATGSSYGFINNEGMSVNDQFGVYMLSSSSIISGHSGYFAYGTEYAFHFKDDVFKDIAGCGLKFYTDKLYKPIISGGVVIGYTDDMDEESELDEWTGTTDHGIGPTPPVPPTPTDVDDMDIMNTGATGSSGGFTHFYIMSPQDLIDLLADFYTRADAGETLSNNLVCSYILGIPSSAWAATESVPVAIHNSAQGTPFVSNDNYDHVTATNNMLVTGTFDVPRRTNTFYDFSPYTTYEVFIPCCGWVRLPDTVAGRTINVYLYLDIASCCVKGQVMISGAGVCAVVNGALGSPIPMAVIESGILRGNNIQAGMGMIGGAIQTGVSAGSGNAMGVGLGAERILTGLVNCSVAGNTNYTEQKGGTGDITQFAMGHQCYMKITHPVVDPVVNEYIFAHTVGYLCNTVGQLSNFHGFTMCSNPHIHISATSTEKEEIKQLLEQGVILP